MFFESIPWYSWLMFLTVLGALIGLNELSRQSTKAALFFFVALPLVLTPVWLLKDAEITSWFTWVKVYSALAGCIIFMVIRYTKFAEKNKWFLFFPALILGVNIAEAVAREFQVSGFNGVHDGMKIVGGTWNYFNATAGILNTLLICGWMGIFVSSKKSRDMIWPAQIVPWIVAYDLWNFAYVYNCAPGNALYSGGALLLACTIPALLWAKGAWLQHRAATLAFWMMWVMTMPYFFADGSMFKVAVSYNPTAQWIVALASFAANVALAVWQISRIIKNRQNPLKDEIYTDLKEYKAFQALR